MEDGPVSNGTSETLVSLSNENFTGGKRILLPQQHVQLHSITAKEGYQNHEEQGSSILAPSKKLLQEPETERNIKKYRRHVTNDFIKVYSGWKAKKAFDCMFPDHIIDDSTIAVGKFGLNRAFNYVKPVVKTTLQLFLPPTETLHNKILRPLILVIVLGPRSSVEHAFRLAQEACHQTWVKPAFLSQFYTQGECDASLLVATASALIETDKYQKIYLNHVHHFIVDDGNIINRPEHEQKAIIDIYNYFHDIQPECKRSLFTAFVSPSSNSTANVLTNDFAFVTVADHATCLDFTKTSVWDDNKKEIESERGRVPIRESTLIFVPTPELAIELVGYLQENNFNAYTTQPEHDFERDSDFQSLSEDDKQLALIEYNLERDGELLHMVDDFNNSDSDFLVLTKETARHLHEISIGFNEVRPTPGAGRKEYSFRKTPKRPFWKRVVRKKKKSAKTDPVSPLSEAETQRIKQEQALLSWRWAKLKRNKIIINYDSHDTAYEVFEAFGARFRDPSEFRYNEFLRHVYMAEIRRSKNDKPVGSDLV